MITPFHLQLIQSITDLIVDAVDVIRNAGNMSEEEAEAAIPDVEAKRKELMERLNRH
jgi:hypothetical protein